MSIYIYDSNIKKHLLKNKILGSDTNNTYHTKMNLKLKYIRPEIFMKQVPY